MPISARPSNTSSQSQTSNESTHLLQNSLRLVKETEDLGEFVESELKHQKNQLIDTSNHVCICPFYCFTAFI